MKWERQHDHCRGQRVFLPTVVMGAPEGEFLDMRLRGLCGLRGEQQKPNKNSQSLPNSENGKSQQVRLRVVSDEEYLAWSSRCPSCCTTEACCGKIMVGVVMTTAWLSPATYWNKKTTNIMAAIPTVGPRGGLDPITGFYGEHLQSHALLCSS